MLSFQRERTELVLEGKLVKTTSADVGMITANRARAYEPGIHISHIVAHPCGKIVYLSEY